ncbi:hypothetical protein KDJ56_07280 [Brevibacillus composti]|uniref:Uncharacterized protein n=1 Tax=Brevibacillus composti TaxID=2796470 RepID=A0A7T5JPS0_9BACL|nr:hypothetical protein [Brevibacillus composti]QQE75733.1 hypothetical protein JD108_07600 [Brevibacillus composti]QUO42759.1 hypothetical protein KDJ56_07280 [Brevibacillus composti]
MKIQNPKPISQIREEERILAEKEVKIAQLDAETQTLKEQNAVMQETINFLLGL